MSEPSSRQREVDLTAPFRFDLRTLAVLLALAGAWYDQRTQTSFIKEQLSEMKREQRLQQYEFGQLKLTLAARGIIVVGKSSDRKDEED